jgi:HD-GYP domain-containing protein (c-di-GMP phosphodiesterase class II)
LSLIDEFMGMIDRWIYETRYDSYRVTFLSLLIGKGMGLKTGDLFTLGAGALLHDIGKLRIPQAILLKRGGLNDEELSFMRLLRNSAGTA